MTHYTLLTGEAIELGPLDPALADFLATAQRFAADAAVSVSDFVEALYGPNNPILTRGVIEGRGLVTKETLQHPAYLVMVDLLDRKRLALGSLDPEAVSSPAAFTVSVSTAASQLGISASAVRQAIRGGRLEALKVGGQHWLRAEDVDNYRVAPRGTAATGCPDLALCMGSDTDGRHLSVRADPAAQLQLSERSGNLVVGQLSAWSRALVKTTTKRDQTVRVREIVPDRAEVAELTHGPKLLVRGRFRVVRTHNNLREALATWEAFDAAQPAASPG